MQLNQIKLSLIAVVVLAGCRIFPLSSEDNSPKPLPSQKLPPGKSVFKPTLKPDQFLEANVESNSEGIYLHKGSSNPVSGSLVEFFPNGQMRSTIPIINGRREGSAKWWGSDGRLRHTRQYEQGRLNGSWVEYYPGTNEPRQEQVYVDGSEILRRGWWPNGAKQFEVLFINGEEKSRKAWDIEGTMTASSSPSQPLDGNRTKLPQKPVPKP